MINLRGIDLNLLVTLDVLLSEHNVTRAAQRLHLSQPSVSVHLAKLRDIFGDPLLLPGPRGMQPTARAEELREPLRLALQGLEQALGPAGDFAPAEAANTWRVAAADYGESAVLLPALPRLRQQAPGTRLAVLPVVTSRIARQAEQGDIDLALHTSEEAPPGLRRRALFTERYVLVARKGHPKLKKAPTLAQFCALEHAIVSPGGGSFSGVSDEALAAAGATRRVVLSVPHFLFLRSVLASTDLVAMLPSRLLRDAPELQQLEAPVPIRGYEMAMLWHERVHRDPAHKWLRETIAAAVAE
ncbi:LysR family transcriptional regulator [Massilia endophytica]|uniref:LysR family transcriptional regulator n=1 Tax=Massilia endophytica TaxID=2899220 RepID=UPI001E63A287|nr:LysR family transcriptional regulator [Massilia endophytica]UGQ46807.1 LysR family transcriptional regulator [Massilia endophytica]